MNDDHIPELILRASAYLDGELSADEMARAEADPAVMAEVEALRALHDQLADVAPAADDTRERAIAAALDEFDLLHGAPAPATAAAAAVIDEPAPRPAPSVVPFRPRPAYTRWLTAAAAVVGIGVLGAVIAGTRGGGDEDSAGGAAATETAAASATAEESARSGEAPLEHDEAEMAPADALATPEEPTMQAFETAEATTAAESATASEPAEGGGDTPEPTSPPVTQQTTTTVPTVPPVSSTTPPPTVPDDLGDIIVDSDNLLEVGQDLLDRYAAGELPDTPETACEFGSYVVLSWARYDVEGTLRPAIIAGHLELREVGVFDAETCEPFDIIVP